MENKFTQGQINTPLPCPFCGCENNPVKRNRRTFYGKNGPYEEVDYYLNCDDCGLTIGNDKDYDQWGDVICDYGTEQQALEVWNKRYGKYAAAPDMYEALKLALPYMEAWAIRGEEPLVGENLERDIPTVCAALAKAEHFKQ